MDRRDGFGFPTRALRGQEPRQRAEAGGLVLEALDALAEDVEALTDGPDG